MLKLSVIESSEMAVEDSEDKGTDGFKGFLPIFLRLTKMRRNLRFDLIWSQNVLSIFGFRTKSAKC